MKKKVLSFIYNTKLKKFLALERNKHPDHAPNGGWFVVTGAVEGRETHDDAIIREIREETGLFASKLMDLNTGSKYDWNGEECEEFNFICFVEQEKIQLSEEHVNFEWLEMDEFIGRIGWRYDKALLKKILLHALKYKTLYDERIFSE